jgi:hypothetical protein
MAGISDVPDLVALLTAMEPPPTAEVAPALALVLLRVGDARDRAQRRVPQ